MKPLDLDTVTEFGEGYEAWTLTTQRVASTSRCQTLAIPDAIPSAFFMREADAQALLDRLVEVNPRIGSANVRPVKVRLLRAPCSIAADRTPGNADSFVVHSPNEVYDWLKEQHGVFFEQANLPLQRTERSRCSRFRR
jgi:hypothetical protein